MADRQVFVPMSVHGMTRIVSVPVTDKAKDLQRIEEESTRKVECSKRRLYYRGEQYAVENADTAAANSIDPRKRLPEHLRRHAYSTQISEAVDFVADRIGEGFGITADDTQVQAVIDAMVAASDTIAAETDDGDVQVITDDPLRDALMVGDTAVHVRWDPVKGTAYLDFWESENVEFVWEDTRTLTEVVRSEVVWRIDDLGQNRQVTERNVYDVEWNEFGIREARRRLYWDDEEDHREMEWLGLGRIPWTLLRADAKGLRAMRGESLVTQQAMETADRYNAVEQVAWLIARYNSHGNVVVVGDGASLKLESEGRVSKDVADVLTFPGGTAVSALTLPTDPSMIEHQKNVLADALFGAFGLTRIDQSTVAGYGGISGYALEILNQKTQGTFNRIARHWRKDWTTMLNLVLDVVAWKRDAQIGWVSMLDGEFMPADGVDDHEVVVPPEGAIVTAGWWLVDPALVFPNRKIKIGMGTGYIVDEVMIRDDFTAGLTSRRYALLQRGLEPDEIDKIEGQIADEAPPMPEVPPGGLGGNRPLALAGGTGAGAPAATKVKAGSTVGTATPTR